MSSSSSSHWSRYSRFYTALGLGQCISILIAGTGVFSTYLANENIFIPTSQSTINYGFLFFFFLGYRTYLYRASIGRITAPLAASSSTKPTPTSPGQIITLGTTESNDSLSSSPSPSTSSPSTSFSSSSLRYSGVQQYLTYVFSLSVPWYYYVVLAIADVEANYVIVQAYHYTTITSIMLLDCSTIPIVMLLSSYLLQRKYSKRHFWGIGICLFGIIVLILSDLYNPPSSASGTDNNSSAEDTTAPVSPFSSSALWGDFLCIIASTLYAISNVGQEYIVKQYNRNEFLGMMGGIGTILSVFQIIFTGEYQNYGSVTWSWTILGSFLGFGFCLFFMYVLTSYFLVVCDATIFNLSLLTSDIWAILAAYLLFNYTLSGLYFVAFVIICGGLFIYHRAGDPTNNNPYVGEGNNNTDTNYSTTTALSEGNTLPLMDTNNNNNVAITTTTTSIPDTLMK